jgi:beta-N-acetylhexosaminidase
VREPLNVLPPAETFGKIDNEQLTYDAGLLTGKELSALGFTLNFAPVMDVNTNPDSPVIGDRSYGSDVNTVIKHSMAFAKGLVEGGVFPCAKHFPGHGDAAVDSHKGLPFVSHNIKRLEEIELAPFKHWAQNSAWPIMTAHVIYPALDKTKPATMSSKILTDILRSEFSFNGVIFSDDLEMGAIANETGEVSSALLSLEAGADALLVCSNLDLRSEIIESIAYKAKTNPTFYNRLKASANRVSNLSNLKDRNVPFSFIGSDTHQQQKDNLLKQINR